MRRLTEYFFRYEALRCLFDDSRSDCCMKLARRQWRWWWERFLIYDQSMCQLIKILFYLAQENTLYYSVILLSGIHHSQTMLNNWMITILYSLFFGYFVALINCEGQFNFTLFISIERWLFSINALLCTLSFTLHFANASTRQELWENERN